MEREELVKRLNDIEWDDFEVKEARNELPKNIWETVSAFSNTSGGWIVLGIRQKGKSFSVYGVDNAEKLEQDFLGTLRSQKFNIRLSPIARQYVIDGKKVLAFYIPSSTQKPVYFGNPFNSFIRMGSGDQRATESEIMAMYHDQSFGIRSELPIPPERMYGTLFSQSRNPTIAKLFRFAKLAENAGFGIEKLLGWKKLTGSDVSIKNERDYVLVTLGFSDVVVEDVVENVVEDVVEDVVEKLSSRQLEILNMIKDNPNLSAVKISSILSINVRTIQRDLKRLKELGLISRVGADRGGKWNLLK